MIHYVTGDATAPIGAGPKIIAHIVNDVGAWGAGFVLAISRRWKAPEQAFRAAHMDLGETHIIFVSPLLYVANMCAQSGIRSSSNPKPLSLRALRMCLQGVCMDAHESGASVHMPRIGCGLAGGKWSDVEPLIQSELADRGIEVTVYDL